jgi:folate-binding protein YgfZ
MFSLESYDALRNGTAFVRRTDRGVLALRGADRATWLQGLVTNDVLAIPRFSRGYGAWLTPQGRMITDLWVAVLADHLLLDVPRPLAAALRDRLDALIFAEDVQVEDVSEEGRVFDVFGRGIHSTLFPPDPDGTSDVPPPGPYALVNDRRLGLRGVVSYLPADFEGLFLDVLDRLGAVESTLDALDVVRIEAGIPKFLADMDEHTIPLEAGLEDTAISFTKGCYVGQEVIVRVTTRGQGRVAKKLVGLVLGRVGQGPGGGVGGGRAGGAGRAAAGTGRHDDHRGRSRNRSRHQRRAVADARLRYRARLRASRFRRAGNRSARRRSAGGGELAAIGGRRLNARAASRMLVHTRCAERPRRIR